MNQSVFFYYIDLFEVELLTKKNYFIVETMQY